MSLSLLLQTIQARRAAAEAAARTRVLPPAVLEPGYHWCRENNDTAYIAWFTGDWWITVGDEVGSKDDAAWRAAVVCRVEPPPGMTGSL